MMLVEISLIASTVALTGVTGLAAYPYEVRRKHAELARLRARAAWEWARFRAMLAGDRLRMAHVTVWMRLRHHGMWFLLQVTMVLPVRVRRRDRT